MSGEKFVDFDANDATDTRDALHAYARVLGSLLKAARPKRKHWWHASLRPSLNGLSTGVINASVDVELELDLQNSQLRLRSFKGDVHEPLKGQPSYALADTISDFLSSVGADIRIGSEADFGVDGSREFPDYSTEQAIRIGSIFSDVSGVLAKLRADIREEASPIQIWPHHFDLSMLWLPGDKVVGQDISDEEYADIQMNFGFTFGDAAIAEPYFYITAYPSPPEFASLKLPTGTSWHSEGFTGVLLPYRTLLEQSDRDGYLLGLWRYLIDAGKLYLPRSHR